MRALRTISAAGLLLLPLVACDSVTEPSPSCTFTLSPASQAFSSAGGDASVTVTASQPSCAWTAGSSAGWASIQQGASGTGSGTITYRVTQNTDATPRSASLTVGSQVHAISQQGRPPVTCTYAIEPAGAAFEDDGGTGSFAVTAPDGCAWTASGAEPWIQITSGTTGSGNGTVAFTVAENNGSSGRSGAITVADRSFTITQLHEVVVCDYRVAPVEFSPCMPGSTVSTQVTAPGGCTWTATPDVPWLTIVSGASGSGSGQVTFSFSTNFDAPRTGNVRVRWPTPTAGQNVRVNQGGCFYGVSPSSFSFSASAGGGTFAVVQSSEPITCGGPTQDRCLWSAVSEAPWIRVTSSMPVTGDGPVNFIVDANGTGSSRTGTIRVRDKVVQITQGG